MAFVKRHHRRFSLSPTQMIIFSFLVIILAGTLLLLLPIATPGENLSFMEALFTAVSGTCVTGLTVIDISSRLSLFGQIVVLGLIQLGGLGIMTFSTFFLYLLGRKATMRGRDIVGSTLSQSPHPNLGSLLRRIMLLVFCLEGLGVVLLTAGWMRLYAFPKALYHGLFHSVSAFCNAGFSLYPDSFEAFRFDPLLNVVVIFLIVLGGLGFVVLLDFRNLFRRSEFESQKLSFHSKVVLTVAFSLIIIGTVFFYQVEKAHALSDMTPVQGGMVSLFQSITARTAGFNTLPVGFLTNGACFLLMLLMFVGAAPGSCGGGVKVTTMGIILAMVVSKLRGDEEPTLFYRSIPRETYGKALTITLGAVFIISFVFLGLLMTENWHLSPEESRGHFMELLFESISAFGTVGLSMGATPHLTTGGRLLIIFLMFVGRLGPLTMAVALTEQKKKSRVRYARGEVMVG